MTEKDFMKELRDSPEYKQASKEAKLKLDIACELWDRRASLNEFIHFEEALYEKLDEYAKAYHAARVEEWKEIFQDPKAYAKAHTELMIGGWKELEERIDGLPSHDYQCGCRRCQQAVWDARGQEIRDRNNASV